MERWSHRLIYIVLAVLILVLGITRITKSEELKDEWGVKFRTEILPRRHFELDEFRFSKDGFFNDSPSLLALELHHNNDFMMIGYAYNSFDAETYFVSLNKKKAD